MTPSVFEISLFSYLIKRINELPLNLLLKITKNEREDAR